MIDYFYINQRLFLWYNHHFNVYLIQILLGVLAKNR